LDLQAFKEFKVYRELLALLGQRDHKVFKDRPESLELEFKASKDLQELLA
jgi:hypothetical protein